MVLFRCLTISHVLPEGTCTSSGLQTCTPCQATQGYEGQDDFLPGPQEGSSIRNPARRVSYQDLKKGLLTETLPGGLPTRTSRRVFYQKPCQEGCLPGPLEGCSIRNPARRVAYQDLKKGLLSETLPGGLPTRTSRRVLYQKPCQEGCLLGPLEGFSIRNPARRVAYQDL